MTSSTPELPYMRYCTDDVEIMWTPEIEDNIDAQFISRIQAEVTQSCALPFPVPVDRIPEFIIQAAGWFWANVDQAVEERMYLIKNAEICKGNGMNKIIQLPPQIMSVLGCHKLQDNLRVGALGDFGVERLLLSSYSMGGGMGVGSFGTVNTQWKMEDAVMTMWEVDTFNQNFNPLSPIISMSSPVSWYSSGLWVGPTSSSTAM